MKSRFDRSALSDIDKALILNGSLLNDVHIEKFHDLLRCNSQYDPRSTLLIQNVLKNPHSLHIRPHPENVPHLQILHSCDDLCVKCLNGHWICCYYSGTVFFFYDSLNKKRLHPANVLFLEKLFKNFRYIPQYFPRVQNQSNACDCGVYAIAFATSIFLDRNPRLIVYDNSKLRTHLYNIFHTNKIIHFPIIKSDPFDVNHNDVDRKKGKQLNLCKLTSNIGVNKIEVSKIKNSMKNKINTKCIDSSLQESSKHFFDPKFCSPEYHVIGLSNLDNVSCYANAALQSLIHCASIRFNILKDSEENYLNDIFREYIREGYVDIFKLRSFAHEQYIFTEQRDVAEFITHLCERSSKLQSLLKHRIATQMMCLQCKCINNSRPYDSQILTLVLPRCTVNLTLQYIIDFNFEKLNETEVICNNGCKCTKVEKTAVQLNNDIIILQLQLFLVNKNNNSVTKLNDVTFRDLSNEKVMIDNKYYKIISAIFHHGYSIQSGHYTNMLRKDNYWLKIDDSSVKRYPWPTTAKDVYLLFLERICEKRNDDSVTNVIDSIILDHTYSIQFDKSFTSEKSFLNVNNEVEEKESSDISLGKYDPSTVISFDDRKKCKNYYQLHKRRIKNCSKSYYEDKKSSISQKKRLYYEANKDKILQTRRSKRQLKNRSVLSNSNSAITIVETKRILANKIKRKYKNITLKFDTIKFLQNRERYVMRLMEKLMFPSPLQCRMEAEMLISTAIYLRDNYISKLKRSIKICQDNIEISLTRLGNNTVHGNEQYALTALCGNTKHCSSTEAYYLDAAYEQYSAVNKIILNERGQSMNIHPLFESSKKRIKCWPCDIHCKMTVYRVDADVLQELKICFEDILNLTYINAYNYLKNVDLCSSESRDSNKLGHPLVCYMNPFSCSSKFLKLLILAYHHPHLRTITRGIYKIKELYCKIQNIEKVVNNSDVDELRALLLTADRLAMPYKYKNNDICLDEKEIRRKFYTGIKEYMRIDTDPPRIPCLSCERLCCNRSVEPVSNFSSKIDFIEELLGVNVESINYWKQLKDYYGSQDIDGKFVCKTCFNKLNKCLLPSMCILNNLFVKEVPHEIKNLNMYEKILIQRAKAFQTVEKMGTVMKKNLPHYVKIDKVKGRTFHLPLPLEETLKKICPDTDPLNVNHELFIMVRSIPTKGKIIWEDYVDVKKIWSALKWLKTWNHLYAEVVIPFTPEDLLCTLENLELQYKDDSEKWNIDDDDINGKNNIDDEKNDNEDVKKAMLTQKNQLDSYYEQYSIYPLYSRKINKTDTNLYQMLQVHATALDVRSKHLDLKCFTDLYPFGICSQHEDRSVKLRDYDFIKSRLTSRHSHFRHNIQYLFYLLHDNNIRQISGGIFHKMNVVDPKYKFTAGQFRQNLQKNQLESNLESIFSRLRGTESYWRIPRNDLDCMMNEYGPATFFVTLSPGEWMWSSLGEYIREVNEWDGDKRSISELIATDPVCASMYIQNRFRAMLAYILSSANPIGEVIHYYYACEYQGRGLPHFHCLFWIKGAPIYGKSSNIDVQDFILQHITCRIPDKHISPEIERRVQTYQRHKHNSYCMRRKKTKTGFKSACRFGFPRPVTSHLILRSVSAAISNRRNLRNKSRFYDLPRNEKQIYINDYMPALLILWEGNNDAQFICESSYLLTKYVSSYGTKASKSEVDFTDIHSNKSLCSRLWSFSMRALNHRECGAIEAADTLLGHPLHVTDPDTNIKWLDVRMIRSRRLKSYREIKNLPSDSTDIFYDSFIDTHYLNRPKELQKMCLYDFAKWFDIKTKKPVRKAEYYEMSSGLYCKKRTKPYLINHWKYNPINQPELYYYALLLLFKPWNDVDELKGDEDTFVNAFIKEQHSLVEAMKYHDKCEVIREAMEKMNEMIQNQILLDDQKENDSNFDNVPEGCVPLETENAMKDFKEIVEKAAMNEDDIKDCIAKFNQDQLRIFRKVTSALQSNDKTLRIFISGPGGTGKSYVIETLVSWNKVICGRDTAVTAPTGLAAYNIQGLTVHRLFQLPVEQGCTAKYKELSSAALKEIRQSLRNVDLIIIDEISMISNIMLLYIHLRLSEIFDTSDCDDGWFGKKHVIVFGDLLQLPPVNEEFAFKKLTKQQIVKYVGGMNSYDLWNLFQYDELIINMRQKHDKQYSEILSRLRLGFCTDEDINVLQERKLKFSITNDSCIDYIKVMDELCVYLQNLPCNTVCLLPTRNMCNILNSAMLSRINSDEIHLIAIDSFKCPKNFEKRILKMLNDDDDDKNCGIERLIKIKIHSKIMIRRNIDVSLGLVNGAIGTIISVCRDKNDEVSNIRIELQSGEQHFIPRLEYKFIIKDSVYVSLKQFSICNSYGITIHKSQGLSLENALVEAGNSIFSCGQTYVALSRVTKLQGVHLINFDPSCVMADKSAILEYNRLR